MFVISAKILHRKYIYTPTYSELWYACTAHISTVRVCSFTWIQWPQNHTRNTVYTQHWTRCELTMPMYKLHTRYGIMSTRISAGHYDLPPSACCPAPKCTISAGCPCPDRCRGRCRVSTYNRRASYWTASDRPCTGPVGRNSDHRPCRPLRQHTNLLVINMMVLMGYLGVVAEVDGGRAFRGVAYI